jgi:predicted DNA-binding transcriptional regulator AlpA
MRILTQAELKTVKGVPYSPQWICKLVRDGLFPKPVKLGLGGRNGWIEEEIETTGSPVRPQSGRRQFDASCRRCRQARTHLIRMALS